MKRKRTNLKTYLQQRKAGLEMLQFIYASNTCSKSLESLSKNIDKLIKKQ